MFFEYSNRNGKDTGQDQILLRHFNTNKTNCQYEIIAHVAHFGSFGEVLDEHITEKNTFNITINALF